MACRLAGSAAAVGLAMSSVWETNSVSMMRRPAAAQRAARLGHVHHGIGYFGHLRLGGTIGERDVGLDPVTGQHLAGELGVLRTDAQPPGEGGQLRQAGDRRFARHREHHTARLVRGLGIRQLAQGDHVTPPLLDAVPPGDTEIEEALGDVSRDLLGTQYPHVVDAGIVDAGPVRHVRGTRDAQVGVFEELQGGALERTFGQDQAEHGGDHRRPERAGATRRRPAGDPRATRARIRDRSDHATPPGAGDPGLRSAQLAPGSGDSERAIISRSVGDASVSTGGRRQRALGATPPVRAALRDPRSTRAPRSPRWSPPRAGRRRARPRGGRR